MYGDPSGHFAISTLLIIFAIIIGVYVVGGATIGSISTAMFIVSKSFWTNKGNPVSLIFGYGLAGYQMYSFWNTLFSEPDFNNSKWILY